MEIKDIYKLYSKNFLIDTDTRKIRKNSIFFCLKGENFNGNKFAKKAISLGASYAIVDEEEYCQHSNIILVDNVLITLQKLANHHRKQFKFPIVGLTGSNGKTTTKELINTVLSKKYKTTATKGNLNNHIGVPLTLLSMSLETEIGIIEMGANHQKEIELLSAICEPDYGYITNFGKAHLEGFGGVKGVIKGKSELYKFLEKNKKTAFINPKDKIQINKTKNIKTIKFDRSLQFLEVNPFVKFSFKSSTIQSNLIGKYNYNNIAIACTIGDYFKVSINDIKSAIESYYPDNNRSQIIKTNSNNIILDAYNANPSSMKVAIENFFSIKAKYKTLILGDMFELGKESLNEHKAIVDLIDQKGFDQYYFVGDNFYQAKTSNRFFRTFDDLNSYFKKNPLKHQSILIKGSRGMRLERLLDIIN
ncbi:UDP-N-acetylmuramoyl-tripeptide--D-alanyl-D-alanine ligase [Polaribacter aquimarinus]|uniref:UDP-N-acetylmuramoyl-tripeptide--D-alanyl-D-alanine ligase n=1 Tax=Polaribacter aquimarinus TaxID=2100726 RepID=A0A2U2JAU7_9FLAO|nr:UDP-N-acetylmuramoyl-tripeptide--D-alanyl-D-alanine ligase [Polaribacter aquimarinus]PWG05466.1 UDP-N-acetylmuramoyl-tripeptide--D-alanyl-D-alanine ligase [Polaribacter aquimarinus]